MNSENSYKKSDLGMFPINWELKSFDELFDIKGGFSASRADLSEKGYCYLHYGDIHGSDKTFIDTEEDFLKIPKLDVSLNKISNGSLLNDGDVVFVDASEDADGTSKHVVVLNKMKLPFVSGLHTIVAKSKTNKLVDEYKRYCFQSNIIHKQFLFYAVGTKVSGISKSNIRKIILPVPSIPEQKEIAKSLNDLDTLLNTLTLLIKKKKDIKQATLQQLLNSKKKHPEFNQKWQLLKLGEIGFTYGGLSGKIKSDFGSGNSKYISFLNIILNDLINTSELEKVNISPTENQNKVLQGDLLFNGSSETPEEVAMCSLMDEDIPNLYLNSFSFGFRIFKKDKVDGLFLTYYLRSNQGRKIMKLLAQGSTRYNLSKSAFLKSTISIPQKKEQIAIAKILFDLDSDIISLQSRLDKIKKIKKSLLQELLTGKTILI